MKAIIRKVLGGDRDAYRAIVKEYGSLVRACLAGHLSSADTVEDLERYGPALVVDHRVASGQRVLVWSE